MFQSRLNPHELLRREQCNEGYLWFAAYDNDMLDSHYEKQYTSKAKEQRCLKIQGFELIVVDRSLALFPSKESSVFVKLYLVKFNSLLDMSLIKNRVPK